MLVRENIARARHREPDATPAEVISALERMYVSALTGTGAAVGATAAAPAVGTGIALALSAGEAFSSLELSTLFVLSVAEVHGIQLDEIERRRTLVMGILLGQSGSTTIVGKVAERTGQHWGRQLVSKVPMTTLKQINKVLGKNVITKYGTKQGIIVLGQVAPFAIGAVIGGGANATVATLAVRAARRAFGPAPRSWPETELESEAPTPGSQPVAHDQGSRPAPSPLPGCGQGVQRHRGVNRDQAPVLQGRDLPAVVLPHHDEQLHGETARQRLLLTRHHDAHPVVHHTPARPDDPGERHLAPYQPGTLHHRVEERLMSRDHLLATPVDGALPVREHGIVREIGEERRGVTAVPGLVHPGRDGAHRLDRLFHATTFLRCQPPSWPARPADALTVRARLLEMSAPAV